jgi:hypothetical protein
MAKKRSIDDVYSEYKSNSSDNNDLLQSFDQYTTEKVEPEKKDIATAYESYLKKKEEPEVSPVSSEDFSQEDQLKSQSNGDITADIGLGYPRLENVKIPDNKFRTVASLQDIKDEGAKRLKEQEERINQYNTLVPKLMDDVNLKLYDAEKNLGVASDRVLSLGLGEEDPQYQKAKKEYMSLFHAKNLLKKADKYIKTKDAGVLKTMFNDPLALDFFTLGAMEVQRGADMLDIVSKYNKGDELTEEESMALFAYGLNQDLRKNSERSIASSVGSAIPEMALFMTEFAITGGLESIPNALAKNGVKQILKKAPDNLLKKFTATAIGDLSGASVRTTVMPEFYSGISERMIGDVEPTIVDGKLKGVPIKETQASAKEAIGKSYLTTLTDVATENFGKYTDGAISKLSKKYGTNNMSNVLTNKTIKEIKNSTGFNSIVSEFVVEEIPAAYIQGAIEGQKMSDVWDNKQMLVTALTIGATGGFFHGSNFILNKFSDDRNMAVADLREVESKITPENQVEIDNSLKGDNIEKNAEQLDSYIKKEVSKGAKAEDVSNIVDYAIQKTRVEEMNSAENTILIDLEKEKEKTKETTVKEEKAPVEAQETVKNTITKEPVKTVIGNYELNELEQKQYDEMVSEKGKEYTDNFFKTAIELHPPEIYNVMPGENVELKTKTNEEKRMQGETPEEVIKQEEIPVPQTEVKPLKQEKNAKGNGKSLKEGGQQTQGLVEGEEERLYIRGVEERGLETEEGKVKKDISTSYSINDLNDLISKGTSKISDKVWQEKMDIARKNRWYEEEDVDIDKAVKESKRIEAKQKLDVEESAPKELGMFGGRLNRFLDPRTRIKEPAPLKSTLSRYFGRTKGLTEKTFKETLKAESAIRLRQYEVEKSVKQISNEIEKAYGGKLSKEQFAEIEKALTSIGTSKESLGIAMNIIAKNVPEEAWPSINKMRQNIDAATREMSKLNLIGTSLGEKIDENTGYYLTRTYKKHTDSDWTWKNIPRKIKEDALDKMFEIYPEMSSDEAMGFLKSLVESDDITSSVLRKGQSIADIDKGVLKKRSQFLTDNPEIRALLGENNDPFYNYAVSLVKMGEIIERGKMVENIIKIGLKDGWLSEKQSYDKNHIAQVEYQKGFFKGRDGALTFDDLWTTPEMAEAISDYLGGDKITNKFLKGYMRFVTEAKIAKTAYSIKGVIRNFKSNTTNAIANANLNIHDVIYELTKVLKEPGGKQNFIKDLIRRGIIGDSSNANEIIRNVKELSNKLSFISQSDEGMISKTIDKTRNTFLWLYGAADDVWKTYRYISEYTKYNKVLSKEYPKEEALEMAKESATDILHKTSTYYSQLPLSIQKLRRFPFINTFVSFPYLTMTNYIGTWEIAFKEIANPKFRHIGIQRIMGAATAVSVLALAATLKNRGEGQDEEDVEAWRRFLPDFWKNDIISLQNIENGKASYSNTSYMDYYGSITTPVLMLQRRVLSNGELTNRDLIDASTEFAKNFIGWDMVFDRVTNVKNNVDRTTGFKIYNESEPSLLKKGLDISGYMISAIEPGTATDARRIFQTKKEGGNWSEQALGALKGSQIRTIDPVKAMETYKLWDYKEGIDGATKIFKNQKNKHKRIVSPGEKDNKILEDAKYRAEQSLNGIINEMRLDYEAMVRVGIKDADDVLKQLMKDKRLDVDVQKAIFNDKVLYIDDEGSIVTKKPRKNN